MLRRLILTGIKGKQQLSSNLLNSSIKSTLSLRNYGSAAVKHNDHSHVDHHDEHDHHDHHFDETKKRAFFKNVFIVDNAADAQESIERIREMVKQNPEKYTDKYNFVIPDDVMSKYVTSVLEEDRKKHSTVDEHHHGKHCSHDHHDHHDDHHDEHHHEHHEIDPDEIEDTEPRGFFLDLNPAIHKTEILKYRFMLLLISSSFIYGAYQLYSGSSLGYEEFKEQYFATHPEIKARQDKLTKTDYPLSHEK